MAKLYPDRCTGHQRAPGPWRFHPAGPGGSARDRAIEAGCDAFLPKPFRRADLLSACARLLDTEHRRAA